MDRLNVVAESMESKLADGGTIITGVGAINVFRALSGLSKDTPLKNIGYVGSNSIPVGTVVRIGKVKLYHPAVKYNEPEFDLGGDVTCYTSCDFVTDTDITEPCVFDMELAFILAMGFSDVVSEKVVSDNLDMEQYHESVRR